MAITPEQIRAARELLGDRVCRTPLLRSESLSKMTKAEVWLKCENLQRTGSFKVRGAFNRMSALRVGTRVVAASMGNHAQAVALAASVLGLHALIVMPEGASIAKQLAVRAYGGTIELYGPTLAQSLDRAHSYTDREFIHPYDDEMVIAGQGTIGLEITEEMDAMGLRADAVIVPVGGGGLAAGIALAVKSAWPSTGVIGVQCTAALSAYESYKAGFRVECTPGHTIADGIAVSCVGERPLGLLIEYLDDMGRVDDELAARAIMLLMERKRILAEGAGAVGLAWLLENSERFGGRRVVLVISGGNIDVTLIDRVIHKGLVTEGRVSSVTVVLEDMPGSIHRATGVISRERGNVLAVGHDRLTGLAPIGKTVARFTVETMDKDHARRIVDALRSEGIEVV